MGGDLKPSSPHPSTCYWRWPLSAVMPPSKQSVRRIPPARS